MRKKPEQVILAPQRITQAAFSVAMRRLLNSDDFKLLRSQLLNIRSEILESGKKKRSGDQWAVLEGFDLAVMEAERWAFKKPMDEDMKERQRELLNILGGEAK